MTKCCRLITIFHLRNANVPIVHLPIKRNNSNNKSSHDLSPLKILSTGQTKPLFTIAIQHKENRFCHSKVIFRAYLYNMTNYFDSYRVPDLQKYLRSRGVSVTGYNKPILKEIAIAVQKLELPEDPDFLRDSVQDCVIKKLILAGLQNHKPLEHPGYTSDFTNIPQFGLIDIFNYLIFNRSDYDGKKLKGYKSYDDYRLFYDGNVEVLEFNDLGDHRNCLFRAKVKPTQKDKTFLNKDFYELWIVLDKEDGYVITAHCECKGG